MPPLLSIHRRFGPRLLRSAIGIRHGEQFASQPLSEHPHAPSRAPFRARLPGRL